MSKTRVNVVVAAIKTISQFYVRNSGKQRVDFRRQNVLYYYQELSCRLRAGTGAAAPFPRRVVSAVCPADREEECEKESEASGILWIRN